MSIQSEKLTDEELEAFFAEGEYEDTDENRQLIKVLDEASKETVNLIIDKMMVVIDLVSGQPLYNYQKPFARRILESLILNDGEILTALFSRQSGKSETVANTVAAVMIMFPVLAKVYPNLLGDYAKGVWVGAFAPVDEQADTLYGRIVSRLTGEGAIALMQDPDINEGIKAKGRTLTLKSGSLVRRQTCHPRATIEGRTYHLILIDECFPAGTPVLTSEGWVPIEDISRNPDKDWIVATQGADNSIEWAPVKSSYKTRRQNDLVRVVHEHGTMYATANHPFVVGGKTVPAAMLRPGESLSLVQGVAESSRGSSEKVPQVYGGSVLQLAQGVTEESNGRPGDSLSNGENTQENWASPYSPWGEWTGPDHGSEDLARLARAGMEPRACRPHWRKSERRIANTLQDRPGASGVDDRGGNRRSLSRLDSSESSGCPEDLVVIESRVVSVSILEPGSPEFDQFSDGADHVYTLEVDHPSHTYVVAGVLVGNCQGADDTMVDKSITPMGASTNATMVMTGTPTFTKNVFYRQIQQNKAKQLKKSVSKLHFEADFKMAAKENPRYALHCKKRMDSMGFDSDEFKLAYRLIWILEAGMFTTSERIMELADKSMQVQKAWYQSPVVVGIDPARKQDSTIVTVVWVDWDHPDEFGFYEHRILNWLDLGHIKNWETQYHRIVEFLRNYNVLKIGVDGAGVGDAVAERLQILMPHISVEAMPSDRATQSKRWKHLYQLLERGKLVIPGHAKTRELRTWQRFKHELENLQLDYKGPYMLAEAPNESGAHDDYCDSVALACILTTDDHEMPEVEVYHDFLSR